MLRPTLIPPAQAIPDSPAPRKGLDPAVVRSGQISAPIRDLELLFSPPPPHTTTPFIRLQSTTDDCDATSDVPQSGKAEDEHTLSAYGDISLSEVIVPPLPAPTHPSAGSLQLRPPQPRLRLKVRRPPMPKRRPGYAHIADPLSHIVGMDHDERWPGSPRPFANDSYLLHHQPLVSPLSEEPTTIQTRGHRSLKNGGSSLERIFDELVPRSPSIRLSPPGSPARQAFDLSQETHEPRSDVWLGRNVPKADDAARPSHFSPTPALRQDKPKETPWRTRLPPRLPIPKWDT